MQQCWAPCIPAHDNWFKHGGSALQQQHVTHSRHESSEQCNEHVSQYSRVLIARFRFEARSTAHCVLASAFHATIMFTQSVCTEFSTAMLSTAGTAPQKVCSPHPSCKSQNTAYWRRVICLFRETHAKKHQLHLWTRDYFVSASLRTCLCGGASASFRRRCVCSSSSKAVHSSAGTPSSAAGARAARCDEESMVPHTASSAASARP